MRVFSFILIMLFSVPVVILGMYLCIGIYHHSESMVYFTQNSFWIAFKQSVTLSSFSAMVSLIIGTIFAKAFYALKQKLLQSMYLLSLIILFMIQPIMILTFFKQVEIFSTLSALSQSLSIASLHLIPLGTLFWITIYRYLQNESLYIAHHISSSKWFTYRYIIFPQIYNKFLLAFLFLFILVFIDQEVPSILGYRTYTEELVSQMTLMEKMPTIVLSSFPSFLLVGILSLGIIFGWEKNILHFFAETALKKESHINFAKIILMMLYFFLGIILFILAKTSLKLPLETLFINNTEVILQTLSFTFSISLSTLALGIIFQYLLNSYASRVIQIIWVSLLLFYLLLPHSLISLALLDIYQKIGLFSPEGDFFLFFIGYVLVLLPIVSLLLYLFSITKKKDYFLDFFPIPKYYRWIKIILPREWRVWTVTFLILMTFTLNELSVSILLIPPGFETMIVKIYNLLHYGDKANIAFLSLVQLFFLIGSFVILSLLSKKALK